MKKTFLTFVIFLLLSNFGFAQLNKSSDVQGLFLTVGVGPRFPIGKFSSEQTIGAGFDIMLSFTDNRVLPYFFYLNIGYQNHPGDYDFYKISDHSSISTNIISFHAGVRYLFEPIIDDMVLLMPLLEGGISYAYIEKYHQYKRETDRDDNLEDIAKLGFHFGGGLSFFLMDIVASYNYLNGNQYFSFNLRLTIPLAVTL